MKPLLKNQALVAGEWITHPETFHVQNPATQGVIATLPNLSAQHVEASLAAAEEAGKVWGKTSIQERNQILLRWRDLITQHKDELAQILSLEQGKLFKQAMDEINFAGACLDFVTKEAEQTIFEEETATGFVIKKKPIGIVAALTPWNFPCSSVMIKCATSLAAGCPTILKPSEETPLIALALADLAVEAGLDPRLLSVITTDAPQPVGEVLCTHPLVSFLTFTGSTSTGKRLASQAAAHVKGLGLELGGNSPLIVFDDADLGLALQGAVGSKIYNAGQICLGTNRLFVHRAVYDEFLERYISLFKGISVGPGQDHTAQMGPLINHHAVSKITGLIKDAQAKGATVVTGGDVTKPGSLFFQPTILVDATDQMDLYWQEIFGPIAAIYPFDDTDDIIQKANETPFGLAAYAYTTSEQTKQACLEELEFGMIGINTTDIAHISAPFGGIKWSGIGREGGPDCLHEFLVAKTLRIQ